MSHRNNTPTSESPWTNQLWNYDLRTYQNFTFKTNTLVRQNLDEFVACCNPANRHDRQPTHSENSPQERWRAFSYEEIIPRDKVNLDIFWLRDESLEDITNNPAPRYSRPKNRRGAAARARAV